MKRLHKKYSHDKTHVLHESIFNDQNFHSRIRQALMFLFYRIAFRNSDGVIPYTFLQILT